MTAQQKMAYVAAMANLEKAMAEVQRAAVITQVGINYVVSLNELVKNLDAALWATRATREPKRQKPQPAARDTSPMRPKYTGD